MGAGQREADRLRLCREAFERAVADGVDLAEGRARVVRDRWTAADQRLNRLRQCGTADAGPRPERDEDGGLVPQWWQR